MSEKAHEVEALALAMFAALPLYLTQTISFVPLAVFHAFMLAITLRVAAGKSPEVLPARVLDSRRPAPQSHGRNAAGGLLA